MVDASVRQMEPYYQLSRSEGVLAGEALCADYSTAWVFGIPFNSGMRGHWAVTLSSSAHIVAFSVLPSLASGMLEITWPKHTPGHGAVVLEEKMVYATLVISVILIVQASALMVLLMRRKSGIISDPGGISGLAALICDSENLLTIFREFPPCVSGETIHAANKKRVFWLKYETVYRDNGVPELVYQISTNPKETEYSMPMPLLFKLKRKQAHPMMLWKRSMLLVGLMLAVPFITIEVVVYHEAKWSPLIVKAIYTFYTTLISSYFQMVDRALRLMQPYTTLVERPSSTELCSRYQRSQIASNRVGKMMVATCKSNMHTTLEANINDPFLRATEIVLNGVR